MSRGALKTRLLEALALKEMPRAGWVRAGVGAPESVAAHSWGVAWLVLALCPAHLDRGRALAIAAIHDLGEVRIGDWMPHETADRSDKRRREREAVAEVVSPLSHRAELLALWDEYADGRTGEGRFVKACDKLDMALQAQRYRDEEGLAAGEFIDSALAVIDDESLRALCDEEA